MKKGSIILSARVDGEVMETVDFDLHKGKVKASRGYDNEPTEYTKKIKKLVNDNSRKIIKLLAS